MLIKDKKKMAAALRVALSDCGYDYDEIMNSKIRTRTYADLRAIVWTIYGEASGCSKLQVAEAYGKRRTTIYSAIERAVSLRTIDRDFSDLYHSVREAFDNALAKDKKV